jgi:DNA-binding MarR family transcriptional regulator
MDPSLLRLIGSGRALTLALLSLQSATGRAMGVHPTDVAIIAHLQTAPGEPARTPGDLARLTGLTTGAITGVIDRLERDGYVRRERDTGDRRKVTVVPTGKGGEAFAAVFGPLFAELSALRATFSADEVATVIRYVEGALVAVRRAADGMREAG